MPEHLKRSADRLAASKRAKRKLEEEARGSNCCESRLSGVKRRKLPGVSTRRVRTLVMRGRRVGRSGTSLILSRGSWRVAS